MGLIRTILALIILLILVHVGLYYMEVKEGGSQIVRAIYGLGALLESPATLVLNLISSTGQVQVDATNFYVVALTAAAGYFILYLLLGVGRNS
jgi:hypothetical protein